MLWTDLFRFYLDNQQVCTFKALYVVDYQGLYLFSAKASSSYHSGTKSGPWEKIWPWRLGMTSCTININKQWISQVGTSSLNKSNVVFNSSKQGTIYTLQISVYLKVCV